MTHHSTKEWIIAGAATLLLAGCAAPPTPTANGVEVSNGGGSAEVQMVTTRDGTRCAVLIGYQKGAITCDWEHSR